MNGQRGDRLEKITRKIKEHEFHINPTFEKRGDRTREESLKKKKLPISGVRGGTGGLQKSGRRRDP